MADWPISPTPLLSKPGFVIRWRVKSHFKSEATSFQIKSKVFLDSESCSIWIKLTAEWKLCIGFIKGHNCSHEVYFLFETAALMTGSPQKMLVQGSLSSLTSPRPLWAGRLPGGWVIGSASAGTTTQRKSPASAQRGSSSTRAAAGTKPQLCSQTLPSGEPWSIKTRYQGMLFNADQARFAEPARIQSLPLVPDSWDLWYKWAVSWLPTTAAGSALSGPPLMPGADLVLTLPAANNNSILFHSVEYNALILSVYFQEKDLIRKLRKSIFCSLSEKWSMKYTVPSIWKCLLPLK